VPVQEQCRTNPYLLHSLHTHTLTPPNPPGKRLDMSVSAGAYSRAFKVRGSHCGRITGAFWFVWGGGWGASKWCKGIPLPINPNQATPTPKSSQELNQTAPTLTGQRIARGRRRAAAAGARPVHLQDRGGGGRAAHGAAPGGPGLGVAGSDAYRRGRAPAFGEVQSTFSLDLITSCPP